jgi:hypothetical protein
MPAKRPRKARELRAALILAGLTMERFAESLDVTAHHLRLVVNGKRKSPRVEAAVDALIAKYLKNGDPS